MNTLWIWKTTALGIALLTVFFSLSIHRALIKQQAVAMLALKARVQALESQPQADTRDIDSLMSSRATINRTISAINRNINGLIESVEALSQRIGRLEVRPVPPQATSLLFIPAAVTNGPSIAFPATPDP